MWNSFLGMKNGVRVGLLAAIVAGYGYAGEADVKGIVAFNEGRYSEAEEILLGELQKPQTKNSALIYLSRIKLDTGESEAAIDYIEKALDVDPTDAAEVLLSGDIYCNHGQHSSMFKALKFARKCIAQYEAAVAMNPENAKALSSAIKFHLAAPSIAGGSTEEGEKLLKRLEAVSAEDAAALRITMLESEGRSDEALEIAEGFAEGGLKSAENQYSLARYYRDKELYNEAKALFKQLMAWDQTPENRWHINDSLLQLGEIYLIDDADPQMAVQLIEEYKQRNSNPHDVHYFWSTWSLAKGYKALGEQEKYEALVESIKSEDYERNEAFAERFEAALKGT